MRSRTAYLRAPPGLLLQCGGRKGPSNELLGMRAASLALCLRGSRCGWLVDIVRPVSFSRSVTALLADTGRLSPLPCGCVPGVWKRGPLLVPAPPEGPPLMAAAPPPATTATRNAAEGLQVLAATQRPLQVRCSLLRARRSSPCLLDVTTRRRLLLRSRLTPVGTRDDYFIDFGFLAV